MAATRLGIPAPAQVNLRPSGRYKLHATPAEREALRYERRVRQYADIVDQHGTPSFAAMVRELPQIERILLLNAVACELKERKSDGKAGQVLVLMITDVPA